MSNIELLGAPGCSDTLAAIAAQQGSVTRSKMESIVGADLSENLRRLRLSGSVSSDDEMLFLTRTGGLHALLVKALNGAPLDPILLELTSRFGRSKYQLIEHNMAREFLRRVHARPGFGAIYLCSPWISFDSETEALMRSIGEDERNGANPVIKVLTRPNQGADALSLLGALGAKISLRRNLHTKLFIREPGSSGGVSLSILGSQNLTRSRYDELGIAVVNDGVINAKLVAYFSQLASVEG